MYDIILISVWKANIKRKQINITDVRTPNFDCLILFTGLNSNILVYDITANIAIKNIEVFSREKSIPFEIISRLKLFWIRLFKKPK